MSTAATPALDISRWKNILRWKTETFCRRIIALQPQEFGRSTKKHWVSSRQKQIPGDCTISLTYLLTLQFQPKLDAKAFVYNLNPSVLASHESTGGPRKKTLIKFSALDSLWYFGHLSTQIWTLLDCLDAFEHFWTVWTLLDTLDAFGHFWTLLDSLDAF